MPVNSFTGSNAEILVAKYNSSGTLQWHTFLSSSAEDKCYGIDLDGSNIIYTIGTSKSEWGTPITSKAGTSNFNGHFICQT